jgi:hypothetical protein
MDFFFFVVCLKCESGEKSIRRKYKAEEMSDYSFNSRVQSLIQGVYDMIGETELLMGKWKNSKK